MDRLVRGLSPFPGAWTTWGGRRLKLLRSRTAEGAGRPGEHLGGLAVACGQGAVQVTEVQPEGRARLGAPEFLRGADLRPGDALGL